MCTTRDAENEKRKEITCKLFSQHHLFHQRKSIAGMFDRLRSSMKVPAVRSQALYFLPLECSDFCKQKKLMK